MADIMTPPASADSGSQGSSDPTLVSGQQPSSLFGVQLPASTGAPGSVEGDRGPTDPTAEPGQVPPRGTISGVSGIEQSGAPGSAPRGGRRPGGQTVQVTDPNYTAGRPGGGSGVQMVTTTQNVGGPNDSTAPPQNYPGQHPVTGTNLPAGTGAGSGRVLRGGRLRGGRGNG